MSSRWSRLLKPSSSSPSTSRQPDEINNENNVFSRIKNRFSRIVETEYTTPLNQHHIETSTFYRDAMTRITLSLTPHPISPPEPSAITHPPTSLLGCPAEIRLMIYEALFERSMAERLSDIQLDRGLTPGFEVLLVCRQIYHECAHMVGRTALVVPERLTIDHDERPETRSAVLLSKGRLGNVVPASLERLWVKELVVRDYVEQLPQLESVKRWTSKRARRSQAFYALALDIDTVFLQLCICRGEYGPYHIEEVWSLYADKITGGIYALLACLRSVRRVVIYICGAKPARFYQHTSQIVPGMKRLFETEVAKGSPHAGEWLTQRVSREDDEEEEAWRYQLMYMDEDDEEEEQRLGSKSVEIEIVDSMLATKKRCVLQ